MPKFTVNDVLVEIDEPYNSGDTITAGEADALNQVRKENIRNNVAGNIKRIEEKENRKVTSEEVQKMVSDYAADYEFGVRGSQTRDPVEAEMLDRARERVRAAIAKKGLKLKDYSAAQVTELARKYLEKPEVAAALRAQAEAVVKARNEVADGLNLDEVAVAA